MENQKLPTIEEVNALELNREFVLHKCHLSIEGKIFLILTIFLEFLVFATLFEEPFLYLFFRFLLFYLILYVISVIAGIGLIKLLMEFEKWIKNIRIIFISHTLKDCLYITLFFLIWFLPVIFPALFVSESYILVLFLVLIYFIYGFVAYISSQYSEFSGAFFYLGNVLMTLIEYIERGDFIFKVNDIKPTLLLAIDTFNKMLKKDNIKMNLNFVGTYFSMLKWFGSKYKWENFILTLYNVLKEYTRVDAKKYDLTKIVALFKMIKETFKDLKSRYDIEPSPTFFQKLRIHISERPIDLLILSIGSILTVVLYLV